MSGDVTERGAGEVLLYQTEDGRSRIDVRLEGGSLWLSQAAMAELFQTTPQNITQHVRAIYGEGEQDAEATCKDYLHVRTEGGRAVQRRIRHYSLEVILAVGYRVRSHRGTQFRQWATERLREYLVKGFVLDDERLKRAGGDGYFEELLERIRDIRSSEHVFYRKVLDIYATSIDYNPNTDVSQQFFAVVQNKMHWAAHGHTAAEVIHERADATRRNMGLTHVRPGGVLRKADVAIAKNYLQAEELETLNRIVNAYLEFAELQARGRRPMHMRDWIAKLDDFLRLSDRDLLYHAGRVSAEAARLKAEGEYERYRTLVDTEPRPVDADLDEAVARTKQLGERSGQ